MRGYVCKSLLGTLFLLLLCTFGASPAVAQSELVGACALNTESVDFVDGLTIAAKNTPITIETLFNACTFGVLGAVPSKFTWTGDVTNASCLAVTNDISPGGGGTLYWDNGQTSAIALQTEVDVALAGVVPAVLQFNVTSGYQTGATFTVSATLVASPDENVDCLGGTPFYLVPGTSTTAFTNLQL